jgi:hypothetical protein
MPMECSPALFGFAPVEGRAVVAGFESGGEKDGLGGWLGSWGLTRRPHGVRL